MNKLASMKLWVFVILGVLFTWMKIETHLTDDSYVTLMMWVIIGFAGGNVGEHMAKR